MTAKSIWDQMNIPNTFSLMRPASLVFIFWWLLPNEISTIVVIAVMGATDGLDGWWAKTFNQRTPLGVELDPISDKLFCWGVFGYLAYSRGTNELWALMGVMVFYDIYNTCMRKERISYALDGYYPPEKGEEKNPGVTLLSKSKTAYLFVLLMMLVPDGTETFLTIPAEQIVVVQERATWFAVVLVFVCLVASYLNNSTRNDRNRLRGITSSDR